MSSPDEKTIGVAGIFQPAGQDALVCLDDFSASIHAAEEGGYWAEVPALPGCVTQGETLDEVVENLNDAIQGWLSVQTIETLTTLGIPFSVAPAETMPSPRLPRVRILELAA